MTPRGPRVEPEDRLEEARRADRERNKPCPDCNGSGVVRVERRLTLREWFTDDSCVERLVEDVVADACGACAALAEAEYQARAPGGRQIQAVVGPGRSAPARAGTIVRLNRGVSA